jgi:hypothetical protein
VDAVVAGEKHKVQRWHSFGRTYGALSSVAVTLRFQLLYSWRSPSDERQKKTGSRDVKTPALILGLEKRKDRNRGTHRERYGTQRIFVVRRGDYIFLVPFVEDDEVVFLKTIIPSRKMTRQYLRMEAKNDET